MKDSYKFSGHFKIESVDKNNNIIDVYEDDNMIMTNASTSMSLMFSNLTNTFVNHFALGTMGHVQPNILVPKLAADGLTNTRDRMFSTSANHSANATAINSVIPVLNQNDVFYIAVSNPAIPGYYRYLGASVTNYTVLDINVTDINQWENLGTVAPYTYNITFNVPGTNVDQIVGDSALNIVEDNVGAGSTVTVLQSGTSTTFNFSIPTVAANAQTVATQTSVFTEAALYANGSIFSLKTFKAKIKDATVAFNVSWTITF